MGEKLAKNYEQNMHVLMQMVVEVCEVHGSNMCSSLM
jgi:hypothetical protein